MGLEDELNKLLGDALDLGQGSRDAGKEAGKIRRRCVRSLAHRARKAANSLLSCDERFAGKLTPPFICGI